MKKLFTIFYFVFLGIRFGKIQPKIAVVLLLQKYKFELDEQHKNTELKLNPGSVVLMPLHGVNLIVSRR